ncbi:MAG: DUF3616 domain-containing protein [Verrucomicrobiales bacterium]|nr:DUF3616 domain-containing protein [Verrucomicrobiales bacterium]
MTSCRRWVGVVGWVLLCGLGSADGGGARPPELFTLRGMCDASAVVDAGRSRILVANDEDNILRLYAVPGNGAPEQSFALDKLLRVDPEEPEADLEGAAALGDRVFWVTSHGRSVKGKNRPSRRRFFAVRVGWKEDVCEVMSEGRPYLRLLDDLLADARLAPFGLAAASRKAPKEAGALNIEALAARDDSSLWIGFRNPIPGGRALVIPLLNPVGLTIGERARFGDPLLLDLGGLGFRDLAAWNAGWLIVAGPYAGGGPFAFFRWDGAGASPAPIALPVPRGFAPEAAVVRPVPEGDELLLLSDDGSRSTGGVRCKDLEDPRQRAFRLLRLPWPP